MVKARPPSLALGRTGVSIHTSPLTRSIKSLETTTNGPSHISISRRLGLSATHLLHEVHQLHIHLPRRGGELRVHGCCYSLLDANDEIEVCAAALDQTIPAGQQQWLGGTAVDSGAERPNACGIGVKGGLDGVDSSLSLTWAGKGPLPTSDGERVNGSDRW